jgi:hypothetical protein
MTLGTSKAGRSLAGKNFGSLALKRFFIRSKRPGCRILTPGWHGDLSCHPECREGSRPTWHGTTMPYPSSALTLIRGVFLTHTSWLTLAFCEMFTRHFGHIVFLTNLLEIL